RRSAVSIGVRTENRCASVGIEIASCSYWQIGALGPRAMGDFIIFALVGFVAPLIDGSLGMGYGVISSSILLAQGVPPSLASASVNAAKLPTTGTAAISHYYHRNLDFG